MARWLNSHSNTIQTIEDSDDEQPVNHRLESEDSEHQPLFNVSDEDDEENDNDVVQVLTEAEWQAFLDSRSERQSTDLPAGHVFEDSIIVHRSIELKQGMAIELKDGDFIHIKNIVHDLTAAKPWKSSAFYLRGLRLRRTRRVNDMLLKRVNELCIISTVDKTESGSSEEPMLVTCPLSAFLTVRNVIFTNQLFPALSFRQSGAPYTREVEGRGVLVCRWKFVEVYERVLGKARTCVTHRALERLPESECDPRHSVSDTVLTRQWREPKPQMELPAKSVSLTKDFYDLTIDKDTTSRKRPSDTTHPNDDEIKISQTTKTVKHISSRGVRESRRYNMILEQTSAHYTPAVESAASSVMRKATSASVDSTILESGVKKKHTYGDICAGGGGTTRGAQMAGLSIEWVLDHCPIAVKTLQCNFPTTEILGMDIHVFCTADIQVKPVDILHISFPCQPHSALHPYRECKNDEANIATGYSATPLLLKARPRVVTIEQTSGIVTHRGGWHFRALVHQLTSTNYSVRWKIMNLAEYGNAHARRRLIIVASCPGEPLPPFPMPTHGNFSPDLKLWITVNNAISHIRIRNIAGSVMASSNPRNQPPYDSRKPLEKCITCSGGDGNLHPSGKRTFNLQELACLQSFPVFHRFAGGRTAIKQQIGNAVPPVFAKILFETVDASLTKTDRRNAAYKPQVIHLDEPELICVD